MATKRTDKQIIRTALLAAIKWDESLLDSYASVSTLAADEVRKATSKRIAEFKELLERRYGGVPADPMADAKIIDVRDIK